MMFLGHGELYRLLQRELPEDVFPDGAPAAFYSTADMSSVAETYAGVYSNLARVWANIFPENADELVLEHERTIMGDNLPASAAIEERKNRYLQRLRSDRGISKSRLESVVRSVIGEDVLFELVALGSADGSWMLGVSQLGISTILGGRNGLDVVPRPDNLNCDYRTSPPAGYTMQEWLEYRDTVYRYEVRIYDYILTADEEERLDRDLTKYEPARSDHTIVDGLDPADMIDGEE